MVDVSAIISSSLFSISVLVLSALGLAIIFGMMGVINMAHGALITVGAYVAFTIVQAGLSVWLALLFAPIIVGVVGLVLERSMIRYLYERPLDTILATWGVSLVLQELIKVIFGTSAQTVPNPLPRPVSLLGTSLPTYQIFLVGLALFVLLTTYAIFTKTTFGIKSRAVIQNDEMANVLGTDVNRIYLFTFMYGTGLAGLAGAALAPVVGASPRVGLGYLVQSFFVVIVGGTGEILAGTLGGATTIGAPASVLSFFSSQTFAQTIVFVLAILVIRIKPEGIFGGQ